MNSMPIGSIILFSGKEIPEGWVKCNGSSVIGTPYAAINNEERSPILTAPAGSTYIIKVREVSNTVILDNILKNNNKLTEIKDHVVYSDEEINKDITMVDSFSRSVEMSEKDIGYTKMNDIVGVSLSNGKTLDITNSLKNRSTITEGDKDLFANEPLNDTKSAVDVLPYATSTSKGLVKIGDTMSIDENGVINVNLEKIKGEYLPLTGGTITGSLTVLDSILSNGNVTAYSDRRVKKDITKLENSLDKISSLTGYKYKLITDENKIRIGLIAQDVQLVLPEVVVKTNDGILTVDYISLIPLLVEAIKELQEKINRVV